MLMRFGFGLKKDYLCTSKEEIAHRYGVFSSFLAKIGQKKVVLHYELAISTLRRKIFLGVCGFFLRNVDVFLGDVERPKVKIYLFLSLHFFHFKVTTQMDFSVQIALKRNVPHLAWCEYRRKGLFLIIKDV